MKRSDRSVHAMAHRILAVAHSALAREESHPVRVEGMGWYDRARLFCADVSIATDLNVSVDSVAGAVAALSPQVTWASQLKFTLGFVNGGPHPGFKSNLEKARRILKGESPDAVLRGLKVRAFYAAIMGDAHSVVVDRHAVSIAMGADWDGNLTDALYREVAMAYTAASVSVAMAPRDLQALTWVEWRFQRGLS